MAKATAGSVGRVRPEGMAGSVGRVRPEGTADPNTDRHIDVRQILRQIDWAVAEGDPNALVIIGVGGFGASGKTTIANVVAKAQSRTQIVATDEFFNGETFDLDRLRTDVIEVLRSKKRATFKPWNWATSTLGEERSIKPSGLVIIEGVCALHQMFRKHYSVRIWINTPSETRLARAIQRDGEASREKWLTVWMPNEAAYVERDQPITCAQAIIDGTTLMSTAKK